tara:strand:- start:609 stop:1352 length:744 start_codon:yes stop_codon:yes gene_type:complete
MRATLVLVFFLALQSVFWYRTHDIVPDMSIVPDVPGQETVKALSFGDEHAFFRLLGLRLQNAGDTFGRFTALYKYDYNKLYHWMRLLDSLDDTSNYIPSMATYYYSQTQNTADVKYIVDYLVEHSAHRVEEKWWWLVQAVYLANHKLQDQDMALQVANMLRGEADIPVWVQQLPAFIHEQRGEFDAAAVIIQQVLENEDDLDQGELNFITHFAEERIERMKELEGLIEQRRQELEQKQQDADTETTQ